jgi:hypothetical protein
MGVHSVRLSITRQAQYPEDEFRIHLYKLTRRQAGNPVMVRLHFSYATNLGSFLSTLQNETALQKENGGFTLKDGPWKYSMMLNGKIGALWSNLKDERSFNDMLHKLEVSEGAAVMIHVSTFL